MAVQRSRNLIASKLIESVRNRAMIPDDITVYDDEAILEILNEEIDVGLLNTIMTLHEEHLVTFTDAVATSEDSNSKRLIIPSRAVGSKLRDLHAVVGSQTYEMSRVDLGEISDFNYGNTMGGDLFYVEGDEIVIMSPRLFEGSRFRMYYHLRPNYITLEKTSAQIVGIDRTTGVIQFDTIPKEFSNLTEADFIQNKSPNKILSFDISVTSVSISTRTITVDPTSIPSRLSAGDWVCFPETSPYPNVPTELHPILAQRAAVFILEAMGDTEGLGNARGKLAQMEKSVQKLLDNRVEGANRKLKSRHGFLQNKIGSSGRVRRGRF